MIEDLKPLFGKFANFARNKMGFKYPPKLFLKNDSENAKSCFGRTAHYDPEGKAITIFMTGRHPKDILRSFAHELVHHTQNLRGDLTPEKCGDMSDKYAQENPHMRKMEEEAYLVGNMCFRDWEDNEKFSLQESKILKENKTMTAKITKESLKQMIRSVLERKILERGPDIEDIVPPAHEDAVTGASESPMDTGFEPEEEHSGCGEEPAGASHPEISAIDQPGELMSLIRAALAKLDVVGNWEEDNALGEGTTQKDVEDAADDAVDATFAAGAAAKKKKSEKKKPEKKSAAGSKDPKYDEDLFDDDTAEEQITGVKENMADCGCTDLDGTPEKEKNLYESRFSKRNANLFEDLVKKWTK